MSHEDRGCQRRVVLHVPSVGASRTQAALNNLVKGIHTGKWRPKDLRVGTKSLGSLTQCASFEAPRDSGHERPVSVENWSKPSPSDDWNNASGGWFLSQEPHGRRGTVLSGRVTLDEVVQFSESELAQLHN